MVWVSMTCGPDATVISGVLTLVSFEKSLEDSVFLNRTIDGFFFPSVWEIIVFLRRFLR